MPNEAAYQNRHLIKHTTPNKTRKKNPQPGSVVPVSNVIVTEKKKSGFRFAFLH